MLCGAKVYGWERHQQLERIQLKIYLSIRNIIYQRKKTNIERLEDSKYEKLKNDNNKSMNVSNE